MEEMTEPGTSSEGTVPAGPAPGDEDPPYLYPDYVATRLRAPKRPLVLLPQTLTELSGPAFGEGAVGELDHDLTRQHDGEPIGQRIVVTGRLLDADARPIRNQLVEVWQANSAGRYRHEVDRHPAPLDPNFTGAGRCLTDDDGRYRFVTVKPGSYPWQNHDNAWRPAHIHFSVLAPSWSQRLVTQMYFPDDPLLPLDPILNAVPEGARSRLVAMYAHDVTEPHWALGWRWDIVLAGPRATAFEAREQSAA